jgi:hypothetical protein
VTRSQWVIGIATIVLTIIAGVMSFDYVNRRFPPKPAPVEHVTAQETSKQADTVPAPAPVLAPTTEPVPAPAKPASACVERDGSWRNWPWPNVPMLSPTCESAN